MADLLELVGEQRTRIVLTIAERAQQRGELAGDIDPDVIVASIIGPLVFHKLVRRRPVDESSWPAASTWPCRASARPPSRRERPRASRHRTPDAVRGEPQAPPEHGL